MNKHEIEALLGLVDNWLNKQNPHYFGAAKELEALLISLFGSDDPAPADGLREGLEELIKDWEATLKRAGKLDAANCLTAKMLKKCKENLEKILSKTPDIWKPIADAPRDEEEVLGLFLKGKGDYKLIKWQGKLGMWVDRDCRFWSDCDFSHFRKKPAPPREPCDSTE